MTIDIEELKASDMRMIVNFIEEVIHLRKEQTLMNILVLLYRKFFYVFIRLDLLDFVDLGSNFYIDESFQLHSLPRYRTFNTHLMHH